MNKSLSQRNENILSKKIIEIVIQSPSWGGRVFIGTNLIKNLVVNSRIRYYNFVCRHSVFDNKPPIKYLKEKGKISI